MLKIFYGDMNEAVYNTVVYFKNDYNPVWFEDPFIQEMVLDVDQSTVLSNGAAESGYGHNSACTAFRGCKNPDLDMGRTTKNI